MLKGISPVISPELLKTLAEMGHGDEIVLGDAHLPGHSMGKRVLRADGIGTEALLDGILALLELDYAAPPIYMMEIDRGTPDPTVEQRYRQAIAKHAPDAEIVRLERQVFYDKVRAAYAVVMTGEIAKFGNIILKKGVTPGPPSK